MASLQPEPPPAGAVPDAPVMVMADTGQAVRQFRIALAVAGLIALAGILFNQDLKNDVAHIYARQVREFAAGNWEAGLFHLTPPLMIALGGLLVKLGLPAFGALKLVSTAFFLGGLWPLARLLRRLVPEALVGWGCLLYALNSQLLRGAPTGLLDPAKVFFLLWLAELVLRHADRGAGRWRTAALCGVAMAGLALSRAEGIFFLPLLWAGLVLLPPWQFADLRRLLADRGAHLARAAAATAVTLLLCLPQMLYIHRLTGIPALESRQVTLFKTLAGRVPGDKALPAWLYAQPATDSPAPTSYGTPIPPSEVNRVTPWRNAKMVVNGLGVFLLGLAAFGWWGKWRRRDWCTADTVCAAVILFNAALFLANAFVKKRYIMPTIPFIIPWAVLGAYIIKTRILDRWHPKAFAGVAILVLGLSAGSSASKSYEPEKTYREFGRWLQEHRAELVTPTSVVLRNSLNSLEYHDGRQPVLAAMQYHYAYWGLADVVNISEYAYTLAELRELLLERRADVLVVDADLLEVCPELRPDELSWLRKVGESRRPGTWSVYRILQPQK